jgi:hypothetical protein
MFATRTRERVWEQAWRGSLYGQGEGIMGAEQRPWGRTRERTIKGVEHTNRGKWLCSSQVLAACLLRLECT